MELLRRPRMHAYIALGLTALGTLLRILALQTGFDAAIGYFVRGAVFPTLYYIVSALAVAWCIAAFFLRPRGIASLNEQGATSTVCRGIAAAATLLSAVLLLMHLDSTPLPRALPILTAVLLLGAAAYLVLPILTEKRDELTLATGYCVIFAAMLLLVLTYFDRYTQMNAPHKAGGHVALLSLMPAVLFALRRILGRAAPRLGSAVTALALYLTASIGLPGIIAYLTGIYTDGVYLAIDVFLTGFACHFAAELLAEEAPHKKDQPKREAT